MNDLIFLRGLALASIVIYIVFDWIDGRRVKDEREELIQLKSLELAHKATLVTLAAVAFASMFFPWINTLSVLFVLILSALYTEVIGKLYYRRRL